MKKKSLTVRTVRTTVLGCLLLGIISLLVGLAVYTNTMTKQSVERAFGSAQRAMLSVKHGTDSYTLAKEVMEIYRSLTPEQRALMYTDHEAYREFYSSIDTEIGAGGTWDILINLLDGFNIGMDDVYVGMYDAETNALVYFANADDEVILYPGDWEKVSEHEVQKFLNWDGEGQLYEISRSKEYGWLCTAGYPIRVRPNNEGELFEFLLVDVSVDNIIQETRGFIITVSIFNLIVTFLMVLLIRKRIKNMIAKPIDAIANAAVAYVQAKKEGTEENAFSKLEIHTGDELENLSHVMADMEKDLARHEDHIREITAEKERINTELSLATRIQTDALPNVFPEREDFTLFASMDPAKEVGGDFYDFFFVDDDHLALVIADVSGKGVPAALFMMSAKSLIQTAVMLGNSPAVALQRVNDHICENNEIDMFVTVWLGILELSTGKLVCANAGHEFPAVCHGGRFALFQDEHGMAVGGLSGMDYSEYTLRLERGDRLFVYTDGVPEAMTASREFFGTERMTEALNSAAGSSPKEILAAVRQAVDSFVGDAEQFDDLTMLCLEYK